jgi:hypothetical protein
MTLFRAIPFYVHGAIELIAAPLLLVAPFVLGFSVPAGVLSFALGVLLIGLALSVVDQGERGSLPITTHAGFDYVLATATILIGFAVGLATDDTVAAIFMAGFGSAHLALTASTRFSRPRGA